MVDSAAADRAAEKVRKLVAMSASPHLEEARTSAFLACRLIRERFRFTPARKASRT